MNNVSASTIVFKVKFNFKIVFRNYSIEKTKKIAQHELYNLISQLCIFLLIFLV